MRRGRWLTVFAVVGAAGTCLLIWFSSEERLSRVTDPPFSYQTSSLKTPSSSSSPSASAVLVTRDQIESRKTEKTLLAFATPISIFGKVIDDRQRPIANATVEIGINDKPAVSGTDYVLSSDDTGRFSLVNVHGISFSIRASKPGFYSTKASTASRNLVSPGRDDSAMPTQDNPVILILRDKHNPVPLIHVTSRQIDVLASGKPVDVDLTTGRVGNGQLRIVAQFEDANAARFDWEYRLRASTGGMVERNDEFAFQAPEDGYTPEISISRLATEPGWSADVSKDYFIKLPDGRYGRFKINVYPGKRSFVVIESFVNPSPGDRNLEFSGD